MKRPGWLGGKGGDGSEDPGDGDRADADGRTAPADPAKDGSAAERSTRRIAAREKRGGDSGDVRRRLADRVGKADDEPKRSRSKSRDEAAAPKDVRPAKGDDDSDAELDSGAELRRTKKPDEADEAARKPNRPRRQPAARARPPGHERDEDAKRSRDEGREGEGRRRGRGRARRDRPSAGKRVRAGAAAFAAALKRGAIGTRRWAGANGPKVGRMVLAGLGAVFALFFEVLGFVLNLAIAAWRIVARPVGAVLGTLDRAARSVSRRLTPARALTVVVAGAAILLALSQYADYRSISIGNGAYADVQSLAPAPETGRVQTGDPHSYVFVPVAIACLLLLAVATVGGRWRACRLIALAGFAAIVVALLVDRPAGLDPGDAALAFEGVKAKLIGGFYAQIAAGVLLIGSSSLLARELRLAGAAKRVPAHSPEREAKPKLRRRTAGTEGTARA